MWYIS